MLKESPGRIIALGDKQCDALIRAAIGSADPYCWLLRHLRREYGDAASGDPSRALRRDRFRLCDYLCRLRREQPITPEMTEMFLREREMRSDREGWIFPSPHKDSGTGHRARIDIAFRDVVTSAGLDPKQVTPHVMGHTALTKLVQAGVDLPTIQKIPGHKTVWCCATRTCNIDQAIRTIGQGLPDQQRTRQVARLHRNYKETLATA
jgi:Phage integrase family